MQILKQGLHNTGSFYFTCDRCGCCYIADSDDYCYVKSDEKGNQVPVNEVTDEIECACPNCDKLQKKYLYEKKVNIFKQVMKLDEFSHISFILGFLLFIFSVILFIFSIIKGVPLIGIFCSLSMLLLSGFVLAVIILIHRQDYFDGKDDC